MENNRYTAVLVGDVLLALLLWLILIVLKAVGAVGMHWALVLSGLVWISWALFALTVLAGATMWQLVKVKRRYRLWKVKRRVMRQAKAAGAWNVEIAGGKALELFAEANEVIPPRLPGETDAQLRARITEHITYTHGKGGRENGHKKHH